MPLTLRSRVTPPPPPSPLPSSSSDSRVSVRHPGYPTNDVLFELDAVDEDSEGRKGVLLLVVHTAAAIFAGNEFDGWLSTSRSGNELVEPSFNELLPAGVYYFHVPSMGGEQGSVAGASISLSPYAIVPNFRQWSFPSTIPDAWLRASIDQPTHKTARARDEGCVVTQCRLSINEAHIVPAREREWFQENSMFGYRIQGSDGGEIIDEPENLLSLRQDLHFAWDSMRFSLLPKWNSHPESSWQWALHAHHFRMDELQEVYHNRMLHPIRGVAPQFLFARYAYDIFPRLRNFLSSNVPRWLRTREGPRIYSCDEMRSFVEGQGKHRSLSPKKGSQSPSKRPRMTSAQPKEVDCGSRSFDSGISGIRRKASKERDITTQEGSEADEDWEAEVDDDTSDRESLQKWQAEQEAFERRTDKQDDYQEWAAVQEAFERRIRDTEQNYLEQWKLQIGQVTHARGMKRRTSSDGYEQEEEEEEERGRKRFRT